MAYNPQQVQNHFQGDVQQQQQQPPQNVQYQPMPNTYAEVQPQNFNAQQAQMFQQRQAQHPQIQQQQLFLLEQQQQLQQQQHNAMFDNTASKEQSSIFFGNIPYDAPDDDLRETFALAGPFQSFRMKIDSKTNKPHGYGFCQFGDADLAASALRNLHKVDIRGRPLKVNFAENKNSNNLREEDFFFRDLGEIVKKSQAASQAGAVQAGAQPKQALQPGEETLLEPQTSNAEEMLDNLSESQEEMLCYALREVGSANGQRSQYTDLVEGLARDDKILTKLRQMLQRVKSRQFNPGFGH